MGINRCIVYLQQTPRDSASGNVLHLLRLANIKKTYSDTSKRVQLSTFYFRSFHLDIVISSSVTSRKCCLPSSEVPVQISAITFNYKALKN